MRFWKNARRISVPGVSSHAMTTLGVQAGSECQFCSTVIEAQDVERSRKSSYSGMTFSACGPFWPCVTSMVTF